MKIYLAKVKCHLSPEDFIPQENPQAGNVGTVAREVNNLGTIALLLITLNCQPLQLWANGSQECSDIVKPHGDQVQLNKVFEAQQRSPDCTVGIIQDGDLVMDHKVDLAQLRTGRHH